MTAIMGTNNDDACDKTAMKIVTAKRCGLKFCVNPLAIKIYTEMQMSICIVVKLSGECFNAGDLHLRKW